MNEERQWVVSEVARQLAPVLLQVAEVQRQNCAQSADLEDLKGNNKLLDKWRCALWGNGSGTPGYLEIARAEDKRAREEDRKQVGELFVVVSGMKADLLREEGKDQLRVELEATRVETARINDVLRTNRWTRTGTWVAIGFTVGGSFAVAWVWSLIRPLARLLVSHLMRSLG